MSYGENMRLLDPFQPELGPLTAADLVARGVRNALLTPYFFGQALSNNERGWLAAWSGFTESVFGRSAPEWPIYAVILLLGLGPLAGLWLMWRPAGNSWLPYLLGTWLMVALTPWPGQFARYLIPVAPLLAIGLVLLVVRASRALDKPWRLVAVYGAGAILVCLLMNTANILASLTHVFDDSVSTRRTGDSPWLFYGPEWTDLEAAAAWLGERAEPGARVATDASHYFFLLSGLETIMPPMVSRPEDAQHLLDGAAVRYLVLGSLDSPGFARRYMEPVLDAFPGLWRPIFTIADTATVVYERVDDLTNRDP